MPNQNKLIVISGPTATKKTSTAIELAKKYNGEVVNFDSLLFYRELNIGTAKPTEAEMQGIPHHMINNHSYKNPINAADYMNEAIPIINKIMQQGKPVFLVGGSGFYLQAVLKGMYDSNTTPAEILERSEKLYQKAGINPFREILQENDSESYALYHENDHYRIRRAVEHFWTTGTKFSQARKQMQVKEQESPVQQFGWDVLHIYLDIPKEEHFKLIQKRTQIMFEQGLLQEVKDLIAGGATGTEKPLNSIGYKEVLDYLDGKYQSLEDCQERITINTRRLAKSQRTWFNKVEKEKFNPLTDQQDILKYCDNFLRK